MADRRRQHDDAEPAVNDDGGTQRLCAATREALNPDELIRFVADPSGEIVPDLARRLPGRGVWIKASKPVVERAIKANVFAKSLKRNVRAAPELPERLDQLMEKRVIEALALANKAGLVTGGFQQVDELIESGGVTVLVQAADAADGGRDRLARKFAAVAAARGRNAPLVTSLSTEQMSLAMGRSNVVHAALIHGGAAERFLYEAERLKRYRSGIGASDEPENAPDLEV
ncbi:RNA-binding protein [Hyphomicrobium sp. LHD-15]|uniref:RNA-binding protein n=1 Tax=Hyphomicrobium sp. LHD-15 TaxID=3072142 RepID=UPI00280D5288|nr:RNA-binding protein [Hyphomicrobium sp. LHD-15]MDQ8699501.1 RNA-binding protein [Hyphomicrobium sp. LHD-15]